jgi:hypothetical protein
MAAAVTAVAVAWAGAVAPALGVTAGVRSLGAGDGLAAIGTVRAAGSWGTAIEVPGLGALNAGGSAGVASVSCASAGSCAAGGFYADHDGHGQGFVAGERNGSWWTAIEVPGLGALNTGGNAEVTSVSCASAGNCAAGGYYTDPGGYNQAFVASERRGRWGTAIEIPGPAVYNAHLWAAVNAVSCPSAGNCVAGGYYTDPGEYNQAFVISERGGTWGTAIQLPFTGNAYYPNGYGTLNSLSCASVGNCSAGGYDNGQAAVNTVESAFVVDEKNGRWGSVRQVPGLAALNTGSPSVYSISCASAGNCAAGGKYLDHSDHFQAFVVSEKNGTWGKAIKVPGSSALNSRGSALTGSVSCAAAGNCAAGGAASGRNGAGAFVVSERNGTWGKAIAVPGPGPLPASRDAEIRSVSCATAGNCVAGGNSKDSSLRAQAFVVSERAGTWGRAIEVPGTSVLNTGGSAGVTAVSCARGGGCVAAGAYRDSTGATQGFVVSQNRT